MASLMRRGTIDLKLYLLYSEKESMKVKERLLTYFDSLSTFLLNFFFCELPCCFRKEILDRLS